MRNKLERNVCILSHATFVSNASSLHASLRVLIQGVPTSLGYAKSNVLKLRKVCERSELRLQNIDPIKRGEFCPEKRGEF